MPSPKPDQIIACQGDSSVAKRRGRGIIAGPSKCRVGLWVARAFRAWRDCGEAARLHQSG